jgi:hypothetical protein
LLAAQNKLKDFAEDRNRSRGSRVCDAPLPEGPVNSVNPSRNVDASISVDALLHDISDAQAEISHLETTNAALKAQDAAMRRELHQLKEDFEALRDQNESFETLLRDKTLDGGMTFGDDMFEDEDKTKEQAHEDRLTVDSGLEDVSADDKTSMEGASLALSDIVRSLLNHRSEPGLIAENKALKDSNKALGLYCSKVNPYAPPHRMAIF